MRWSGIITDSVAMNLSKLPELMEDRRPGVVQSVGSQRVRRGLATEPTITVRHGGVTSKERVHAVLSFLKPK